MALVPVLAALQVLVLIAVPSLKNASGPGSDEVNCAEDVEGQPAKGADAVIDLRTRQGCPEVHEHRHSQDETSCGGDERLIAYMLQNLPIEASQHHDHIGNYPLDQQRDFPAATTGRGALETTEVNTAIDINSKDGRGVSREERYREAEEEEEEVKRALKFSYFSTGVAGAGILSIFSGYLGVQTGHAHTIHLKVCTFFMLVTFVCGASMLLLTYLYRCCHISVKTFRSLEYATLGFLTLTMFDVSFLFLKTYAILAFVPAMFVVMIAFLMDLGSNGSPWSCHQGNISIIYPKLSETFGCCRIALFSILVSGNFVN